MRQLVVDPVLVSTSGHALAEDSVAKALLRHLTPLAALITPNIPEASALLGERLQDRGSPHLVVQRGGSREGGKEGEAGRERHGRRDRRRKGLGQGSCTPGPAVCTVQQDLQLRQKGFKGGTCCESLPFCAP